MLLPLHLLLFWYPTAAVVFERSLKNILLILEEDLAVGLMFKLLFVPLFHDSSIVGRVLSFLFRLSRVLIGIFGFLCAVVLIFFVALIWFSAPITIFLLIFNVLVLPYFDFFLISNITIILLGLAIFLNRELHKNIKPVWKVNSAEEIWKATPLNKNDVRWKDLLESEELKMYLASLELETKNFSNQDVLLTNEIAVRAFELAKNSEARFLTEAYFWVAMLEDLSGIDNELMKINLKKEDFEGALLYLETNRNRWRRIYIWDEDFGIRHLSGINRGWLGAPTPDLDAISVDVTREISRSRTAEFAGRQDIVTEVITVLSQARDRNVMLVGEPGAGKSTLVSYLAKMILRGDAPDSLATKRVVKLEAARLLSAVRTEGELAEKIKKAFEEVEFVEDIIIFIDEIHELGIGDAGKSFNLYSLLLPYLESDRFQFIATTEPRNYAKIIEKNSSFARIFHKIELGPAKINDTVKILINHAIDEARFNHISTTYLAIKFLVEKCSELIHTRVLPDSALMVYEECLTEAVSRGANPAVNSAIIKEVLSRDIKMPVGEFEGEQKQTLLNLEGKIHERMIDQEEAVKKVSDTLRRASAQIRDKNRPIGSFLFVGPTGVGKTELAKTLAEVYFSNADAFIRFDMSEYQTLSSIDRLIGTSENPGELTESVRNRPYCLLLLDEFEKAEPKILNLFLQVLDDGRLTDADGVTTDFTQTIIIATSNAGSLLIADGLKSGKSIEDLDKDIREELLRVYRPELVNRFDAVVAFKPLSEEDLEKIVRLKLEWLKQVMKKEGYLIEFNEGLVSKLAEKGYDPMLGARPLKRVMQDTLEAKLSKKILEGSMPKGEPISIDESYLD